MKTTDSLAIGTQLCGGAYKYKIEEMLGQGSFGITYLASTHIKAETIIKGPLGDIKTVADQEIKVAVKEFFMSDFNTRKVGSTFVEGSNSKITTGYRRKFHNEAILLSKLNHPNIVRVLEVFETNGTTYYSMQYVEGCNLDNYIKRKGKLEEQEALDLIVPIANALGNMHGKQMLHLDLKPKNIMLDQHNTPYLIDFGLSKQFNDKGEAESSTTIGLGTKGYAPIEQANYEPGKGFPSTIDIYALGGTLYKMLTGNTPPDASDVLSSVMRKTDLLHCPSGVSESTWNVVKRAMYPIPENRLQNAETFMEMIGEKTDATDVLDTDEIVDDVTIVDYSHVKIEKQLNPIIQNLINNMIRVKGGLFIMGTTIQYLSKRADNIPAHTVQISSFSIGKFEVTQEEWVTVMNDNPSCFIGAKKPVERVSWDDCQSFIHKLNLMTVMNFRLPTEAEWEFAARGGNFSNNYKYAGNNVLNDVAWCEYNSDSCTHDVGSKKPNELGIYDMNGNVWEWCQDWYNEDYYAKSSVIDPQGPGIGSCRVKRGGSWSSVDKYCLIPNRGHYSPNGRLSDLGFRLAL